MQVHTLVRKRVGVVVVAAIVALGSTACFPDTSSTGPSDPTLAAMYQALNADRAANGLGGLTWSPKLTNLAGTWAHSMAATGILGHQNLAGIVGQGDFAPYWAMGENILVGPGNMSAGEMEAAWMNSSAHRANILSGNYNVVGIGVFHGGDGRAWAVVDFGGV
jgi:uncharacterized protein YkwD